MMVLFYFLKETLEFHTVDKDKSIIQFSLLFMELDQSSLFLFIRFFSFVITGPLHLDVTVMYKQDVYCLKSFR